MGNNKDVFLGCTYTNDHTRLAHMPYLHLHPPAELIPDDLYREHHSSRRATSITLVLINNALGGSLSRREKARAANLHIGL